MEFSVLILLVGLGGLVVFSVSVYREFREFKKRSLDDRTDLRVQLMKQGEETVEAFTLAAVNEAGARELLEAKIERCREELRELKRRYKANAGAHILGDQRLSPERRLYLLELYCQYTGKRPSEIEPEPDGDAFVGVRLDPVLSLVHKTTLEMAMVKHLQRVYLEGERDGGLSVSGGEEEGLDA